MGRLVRRWVAGFVGGSRGLLEGRKSRLRWVAVGSCLLRSGRPCGEGRRQGCRGVQAPGCVGRAGGPGRTRSGRGGQKGRGHRGMGGSSCGDYSLQILFSVAASDGGWRSGRRRD